MARIGKKILFLLRLATALLILSCLSPAPPAPASRAVAPVLPPVEEPRLVVRKSSHTLTLYLGDRSVKTYRAAFGRGYQDGDKRREGDKRTPEGDFYICTMKHSKRFYKFLGISYPGLKHAEEGLQSGRITPSEYLMIRKAIDERQPPPWGTRLGGAVGIHGRTLTADAARQSLVSTNWTDGCIALDNADVDELFSRVSLGTPVTILP
jgi:murein L,D-transpeptidase YafK